MSKTQTKRANGRIQVKTYESTPFDELPGAPSLMEIHVTETFEGDIEGDGIVRFIQAARADGSATFVGIERVRGSIHGKKGTFMLQDKGTLVGKEVKGEWFVVPDSGTDDLRGLRGEGGFSANLGENATIWLEYSFE